MNIFVFFAVGTGMMLGLPIFVAICVAYCQRRSSMLPLWRQQHALQGQEAVPTSDWEDDGSEVSAAGRRSAKRPLKGRGRNRGRRPEKPPQLMKVYFRTSTWCSHGRAPVLVELDLEDVSSVAVRFAPKPPCRMLYHAPVANRACLCLELSELSARTFCSLAPASNRVCVCLPWAVGTLRTAA